MNRRIITFFAGLTLLMMLSSCTSSTRITSEPEGASVSINGQRVGETPYIYEDSKISFSKTHITLEKEGYERLDVLLKKDEEVDVGAIIGGVFFYWPFIWTFGYYADHHYVLLPLDYSDPSKQLPKSKMKQIDELNEMYKQGIIDEEEFETLKKRILKKAESY